jgi:hypothetical protein
VSSSVGAVSEQCRSSVGQCRGLLTVDLLLVSVEQCRSVGASECRSVGVSERRSVGVSECRSVGVSGCRVGVRWVIVSSSDEVLWIWMS